VSVSVRDLVGWHRGPEETGTGAAEEFLGGGDGGTHLTIHQSGFLTDNCTKDRVSRETYDPNIQLHGTGDPRRTRMPCFIPSISNLIQVICSQDTSYRDEDARAEEQDDDDLLLDRELETPDDGDGKDDDDEVADGVYYACCEEVFGFGHTGGLWFE